MLWGMLYTWSSVDNGEGVTGAGGLSLCSHHHWSWRDTYLILNRLHRHQDMLFHNNYNYNINFESIQTQVLLKVKYNSSSRH